ncbi:kinase-like domain-containing protein [Suillus lakei]|nr:kinase-like domain-containing protein [Suillus lakei]
MGIADGLKYLHSEDVVHGDLHPANVLIDRSGYPRLTDFGLATVVGDAELQLNTTTANRSLDPRWRAPEVIGIHSDGGDPVRPNFQSDVYSFGGVILFIVSGDIPWKEKKTQHQIIAELLKRATPARPNHVLDDHWNLIQKCWSWDPADRPKATKITITTRRHDSQKNIVVFGETGVGRSSLINLMAGEEVANISPDIQRCTMHWQEYTISFGGDSYKVFDTVGLEEPGLGVRGYLETVENAYRLVKALDREGGIDLLLFCIRAGRLTATLQSNYRLFHEFLCEKKVPIVLVITGLERERTMEDWWDRNKKAFEKFRIQVAGHACITAASGLDGMQRVLYEESRITIRNLVEQFTADGQKQHGQERTAWNLHVKKKNIASHLMKRCGISKEVAQQLVGMMKQE